MVAVINAVVEININTATDEELKLIEAAKASLHNYEPIEYKDYYWLIESVSYSVLSLKETICKIVLFMIDTGKKKPVDFHVEVNPNFMPSQEQLDAGGGGIEKFFTDEFFENVHKGFAKE